MRAEAGFRRVAAAPVLVARQAVQPAIRAAAVAEIVHQFRVAAFGIKLGQVERQVVVARQPAQEALGQEAAVGGEHVDADRQVRLAFRHRRRLHHGGEPLGRQHRERQQVAAAEQVGQRRDARVRPQVRPFHVDVGDAGAAVRHHLVARTDHVAAGAQLHLGGPAQAGQQIGHVQRHGRERRHLAVQRHRLLGAHAVQRQRAGGNGRRVAVLQP